MTMPVALDAPVAALYKLTRTDGTTRDGYSWLPAGTWREFSGEGAACGPGWSHWYTSPALAALLNPIHAAFPADDIICWRGEGVIGLTDYGLKVMCARARILKRVDLPAPTSPQRVAFGILCPRVVFTDAQWVEWADGWLSGRDRSQRAAARARLAGATWMATLAAWAAWAAALAAEAAAAIPLALDDLARRALAGPPW